jgi:hypothetical protein
VRCRGCGSHAAVTWVPGATPASPEARWECTCGVSATLGLHTSDAEPERERPPRPCVAEELFHADRAARQLPGIVASLRRLEPLVSAWVARWDGDVEPHGVELETCRSGVQWAWQLVRRCARELEDADPRRALLGDVLTELASAAERLTRRDLAGAADAVAHMAAVLDALLVVAGNVEVTG